MPDNNAVAMESSAVLTPAPGGEVLIFKLYPTQMTLGYAEVLLKRQQWRALDQRAQSTFLAKHPMPAVLGPKKRHYIVDHHHLARALLEEKVTLVPVEILADLSALDKGEFWSVMDYRNWVHPYDAKGRKHPVSDLYKKVSALRNDSYRSLAAAVRMAGGVAKEQTPFAEFLWADFFRRRISAKLLEAAPSEALTAAIRLAHDRSAKHLPGWIALSKPT